MPIATIQLPDGRIAKVEVPEGATPQAIESFVMGQPEFQAQPQEPSTIEEFGRAGIPQGGTGLLPSRKTLASAGSAIKEAALEIGPGLGELASGAFQRGAELVGREDISGKIGQQVEQERAGLTTAQKVGRGAGQIIGTAPIAAGGGLLTSAVKGGAAISALTPTEEGTREAAAKQLGTGVAASVLTAGAIKGAGAAVQKAKQLGSEAIKRVKSGLGARTVEQLQDGAVALKQKSSDLYQKMRELNSDISKRAGTRLATNLDETLAESGKLNQKLHGDTISVVKDIRADATAGKISLEGLDQHRQNLNAVIQKNTDTISGQVNDDGRKASILIDKIDDLINGLKPSDLGKGGSEARALLDEARKDWKVYSKFQRIANLAEKADGDPNRIKAIFQQFVSKKKNLRGFTPDEVESLKFAAKNTGGEKLLKTFGKFGFDFGTSATAGNTALPALSLFTGGVAGAPIGGGLAVTGGTAARQIQKLVARGKIDDALNLIQQGGVDVAEVISKIPSKKAQRELLTRLLSVGAAQQSTQE